MKGFLLILFILSSTIIVNGQKDLKQISDSILFEAKKIYKLEKSAWKSTDYILETYSEKYYRKKLNGYLSYLKKDTIITIYWQVKDNEIIIKNTFKYENTESLKEFEQNHDSRTPTINELKLIEIRNRLVNELEKEAHFYTKPSDAKFNIILTKKETSFIAYLLISFDKKKLVPLGNDYFIELNNNGEVIEKKRLHKSYLKTPFNGGMQFEGNTFKTSYHTHLSGFPFISITDICNVMLYSDFIEWGELVIISASGYASTYNVIDKTLRIELTSDIK